MELTQYEQEKLKKYKDAKSWFDIAIDMIFEHKVKEDEGKQQIPTYQLYMKFKILEKKYKDGRDVERNWAYYGEKTINAAYNALKVVKIPEGMRAIQPSNNYQAVLMPKGDPIPDGGKVLDEVEQLFSEIVPEEEQEHLRTHQVVFIPSDMEPPENSISIHKHSELIIPEDLVGSSERIELKDISWLKKTTVWNFNFDTRFSEDDTDTKVQATRIPPQIIMNLMYRFTKPGDLVIDPFAGSGTTYKTVTFAKDYDDMANIKDRFTINYDIKPLRDYIRQHDIMIEFPDIDGTFKKQYPNETYKHKLVFFDPPYWSMVDFEGGFASGDLPTYYKNIKTLAQRTYDKLKEGDKVAFIIMDQNQKDTNRPVTHGVDCYCLFRDVGFKLLEYVIVPYLGTKQVETSPEFRESGRLIGTVRTLFVMEK